MVRDYRARDPLSLLAADFWGGKNGEDGYLKFGAPPISNFEGFATDLTGFPETPPGEPVDGKCTRFPLEVGNCLPDQIEFHLQQTNCVARFPYHHTFIVLLEEVGPSRWAV
jgi:hypothetical protein